MGLTSHDSLEVSTCFNLPVGIPNSSGKSEHGLCLDVPCGLPFYSFYLSHQNSDQRINMNQQTSLAMPACLDVYVTHLRVFFPIVLAPYPNLWGLLGLKFPNKSTQLHPHGRNHQESWSNSIRKSLSPRPRVCFVPMVGPAHTWPWGMHVTDVTDVTTAEPLFFASIHTIQRCRRLCFRIFSANHHSLHHQQCHGMVVQHLRW